MAGSLAAVMIATATLPTRNEAAIRQGLVGFSQATVDAALRFHAEGTVDAMRAMLPGFIEFHLPRGSQRPPAVLADHLRLTQDLGLDSLALIEMAFKLDELFGVVIETREVTGINTVGELVTFLKTKFGLA